MVEIQAIGVDILMGQHGAKKPVTDFRRGQKLGQRDQLIVIEKPKTKPYWMSEEHDQTAPDTLTIRELKAGGKVLVTGRDSIDQSGLLSWCTHRSWCRWFLVF